MAHIGNRIRRLLLIVALLLVATNLQLVDAHFGRGGVNDAAVRIRPVDQVCIDMLQAALNIALNTDAAAFEPLDVRTMGSAATTWDSQANGVYAALSAVLTDDAESDLVLVLVGNTRLDVGFPAPGVNAALNFTLETAGSSPAACEGGDQLPSLLFARASSAEMTINGVNILLSGMIGLRALADGSFEMSVADGEATLNGVEIAGGNAVTGLIAADNAKDNWSEPRRLTDEEQNVFDTLIAAVSAQFGEADDDECEPPAGWLVYIVPPGDSLWRIAVGSGSTLNALVEANCIANPNILIAGQALYVPRIPPRPAAQPNPVGGGGSEGGTGGGGSEIGGGAGEATIVPTAAPTCVPGTPGCNGGGIEG